MNQPSIQTADVKGQTMGTPGATLAYDIREPDGESTEPTLLLIGQPMDASGFNTLAGHFRDRRVVTYDPRGVSRSELADDAPQERAGKDSRG